MASHSAVRFAVFLAVLLMAIAAEGANNTTKEVRCNDKKFPECYDKTFNCPEACPRSCNVDCASCEPVCPPTPPQSAASGLQKAKCKSRDYPDCYGRQLACPSDCPKKCEVDCVTCKAVCGNIHRLLSDPFIEIVVEKPTS